VAVEIYYLFIYFVYFSGINRWKCTYWSKH